MTHVSINFSSEKNVQGTSNIIIRHNFLLKIPLFQYRFVFLALLDFQIQEKREEYNIQY
jgi:hypothetical protein